MNDNNHKDQANLWPNTLDTVYSSFSVLKEK